MHQAVENPKLTVVQLPALTTIGGDLKVRSPSPALARARLIAPPTARIAPSLTS